MAKSFLWAFCYGGGKKAENELGLNCGFCSNVAVGLFTFSIHVFMVIRLIN